MNYKQGLEKVVAKFEKLFEWIDFSVDLGSHILVKRTSSYYATEETERNELVSFLTTTYKAAYLAGLEAGKGCKSEFPDVLSRIMNEQQLEAAKAAWEVSVSSSCDAISTLQEEIEKQ